MSIQAIAWVLDHSQAQGIPRLVLLALANHANAETGECHPGQRRIAHEANCSTGMVGVAVKELAALGEVVIAEPGRGRATTKYHLPWLSTGLCSARPASRTEKPVVRDGTPVVREKGPVVRDLDRAKPEPLRRTASDAAETSGVGAARPSRDAREIADQDAADRTAADQLDVEKRRAEIAAMHDELRHRRTGGT